MRRTMYLYKINYEERIETGNNVWLDFSKNILAFDDAMAAVSFLLTSLKGKTIRINEVTRLAPVDYVYRNILSNEE